VKGKESSSSWYAGGAFLLILIAVAALVLFRSRIFRRPAPPLSGKKRKTVPHEPRKGMDRPDPENTPSQTTEGLSPPPDNESFKPPFEREMPRPPEESLPVNSGAERAVTRQISFGAPGPEAMERLTETPDTGQIVLAGKEEWEGLPPEFWEGFRVLTLRTDSDGTPGKLGGE